ncbi:hypothetical protein BU17DRAFT_68759 [Hysterangium stoloniferum]|nr:hypothetical protein BU17DRAFT_68759 [Hysterangium stoloniferum]
MRNPVGFWYMLPVECMIKTSSFYNIWGSKDFTVPFNHPRPLCDSIGGLGHWSDMPELMPYILQLFKLGPFESSLQDQRSTIQKLHPLLWPLQTSSMFNLSLSDRQSLLKETELESCSGVGIPRDLDRSQAASPSSEPLCEANTFEECARIANSVKDVGEGYFSRYWSRKATWYYSPNNEAVVDNSRSNEVEKAIKIVPMEPSGYFYFFHSYKRTSLAPEATSPLKQQLQPSVCILKHHAGLVRAVYTSSYVAKIESSEGSTACLTMVAFTEGALFKYTSSYVAKIESSKGSTACLTTVAFTEVKSRSQKMKEAVAVAEIHKSRNRSGNKKIHDQGNPMEHILRSHLQTPTILTRFLGVVFKTNQMDTITD